MIQVMNDTLLENRLMTSPPSLVTYCMCTDNVVKNFHVNRLQMLAAIFITNKVRISYVA